MTLKELQEQQGKIGAEIKKMADLAQERAFTGEEEARWKTINGEYDALTPRIDALKRSAAVQERLQTRGDEDQDEREKRGGERAGVGGQRPGREDTDHGQTLRDEERGGREPDEEERSTALRAWFRAQSDLPVSAKDEAIARRCGLSLYSRSLDVPLLRSAPNSERQVRRTIFGEDGPEQRSARGGTREARALSGLVASSGGYLVPGTLLASLEIALLQFGGVREVAEIIRTAAGEPMTWPGVNDTSNTGEIVGENSAVSEQDVAFSGTTWNAYKFSSKLVKVPSELLEDSIIDLPSVLGALLGERIGRIQNTRFTTGTGSGQPNGIVTAATLGVTAASATAITSNELLDLVHSIDPAYRKSGCGFMLHDSVLLVLRKLKDATGAYIWQAANIANGLPQSLLGYPVINNQDMASSVATTNKTVLFGQLSKYKIRDVGSIRIRRLVERYADTDQEGFVAFLRGDGNLLNAGTNPVKYLQQA